MEVDSRFSVETELHSVTLKKQYIKVFNLFPASNRTFVFKALIAPNADALVHCDTQGNILFEHKFSRPVDSIAMASKDQVIALQPKLNQITLFNLTNHSALKIPFNFMNEETDQSMLYTFSSSKFICVVENGRYNDNRFKLSYFSYPLSQQSKPFDVFQSESEWNYQYLVKKGNEDSMVLWFKSRQDQQFQLKHYEFKENHGAFCHYLRKNQIGLPYNCQQEIQLAVLNAWEMAPGKFCLACNSDKNNLGLKNSSGCVNNNFIWNVKTNELRETNFCFEQKYNDYLIDIHSFGEFSIFRTYYFQNGNVELSPCYYVHNRSEKIVATDSWECTYLVKFEYPGYEKMIVESQYENSEVSSFRVRVKRVVQSKQ